MGYNISFSGKFDLDKPLTVEQFDKINSISDNMPSLKGTGHPESSYCDWEVDTDDNGAQFVAWNGSEKFYDYVEWITYMIKQFFVPWGRKLNGEVEWYGEDRDDIGKIVIEDNKVTMKRGSIVFD
jgi:hypothetical protein